MKYFINGAIHFDSGELPNGAIALSDDDYDKLSSGQYIMKNGQVVPYVADQDPNASIKQQIDLLKASLSETTIMAAILGDETAKGTVQTTYQQIQALKSQLV